MSDDPHLLARIEERVGHIDRMMTEFVRKHEFRPIQLAVFGMIGVLLSALLAAVVASVLRAT